MKIAIHLFGVLLILSSSLTAQDKNFKEQAIDAYGQEHYHQAIRLMRSYVEKHPEDAEGYYYLGFFIHYNAYDRVC